MAVVIALTGTADALPGRNTVQSDDIKRTAVTTPKIKNGAVTTPKLRNGAVTTPKTRNGAVTTPKIRDGAVTTAKIQDHTMWALVSATGTLIQGSGAEDVNREAPGVYQVRFVKNVSNRAITATVYSNGSGLGQVNILHCDPTHPIGGCALDPDFDNAATAFVNTEDSAGANVDLPFLVVAHPLAPGTQIFAPRPMSPRGETRH
ncbi:MAG: hypothetical protein M3237_17815 [Actinomycetota bacterium]|nr:hypothetical protein [Actinomycetota bacterium]